MYYENSKKGICLVSFSKQLYNIWVIFQLIVFETTAMVVTFSNLQYFPLASFARSYRVTDEVFIAET